MKQSTPILGVVVVVVLTLVSGAIHGRMSNRWGPSPDMLAAAKRLESLPTQLGPWHVASEGEMSDYVVNMLECTGYLVRVYEHQETFERVTMTLLVGPSGPMSVHTPDICLPSRDFAPDGGRERVAIAAGDGRSFEVWRQAFRANDLQASRQRVYYGWGPDGSWSAPNDPRFEFAREPFLYKVQVSAALAPDSEAATETPDAGERFLQAFAPVAAKWLAPPSSE